MSTALVQARHVEILATLASAIARSNDLDSVLEAALTAALAALDLPAAGIFLVHEETGELRATSHHRGVPAGYVADRSRASGCGEGPVGRALDGRGAGGGRRTCRAAESVRESTRAVGLRSGVFVPLFARGRAVGVMTGGRLTRCARSRRRTLAPPGRAGRDGGRRHRQRAARGARAPPPGAGAGALRDRPRAHRRPRLSDVLPVIAREAALLGRGDAVIALIEGERGLRIAGLARRARPRGAGPAAVARGHARSRRCCSPPAPSRSTCATDDGPARALVVPLAAGGRTMGGLIVVKAEGAWSEEDATLARARSAAARRWRSPRRARATPRAGARGSSPSCRRPPRSPPRRSTSTPSSARSRATSSARSGTTASRSTWWSRRRAPARWRAPPA